MTGEFCGASLFRGFPAFQRPTEAREKERHLRNFEIPGYRRGHNIPEASLEPPYMHMIRVRGRIRVRVGAEGCG